MTLIECDSSNSDDSPFGGNFNTVETDEEKLEKFKSLREQFDWGIKKERRAFFHKFKKLITGWQDHLPNLRDFFQRQEIEWMLLECVKIGSNKFISFVARTGYRDEPDLDEDGKPLLRRNTPVNYAAEHRIRDCVSKLSELFKIYDKFNVNYTSESGFTHFHAACMCGCDDIVKKFLELGQDPNCIVEETGISALHLALHHKQREVVQLLVRSHADPNWASKKGLTPLHIICRGGNDVDLFEEFFEITNEIQQTVQIEARDTLGRTPLHWALHYGHMKLVDLLLRRGADVNSKGAGDYSCLHFIGDIDVAHDVTEKFFEICGKIQLTVQVNALDNSGRPPLHLALRNGKQKMVECLLKNGADPNIADAKGFTSLHVIALRGLDDLAEKFFEICNDMQLNVEVNAQENNGWTPLHVAVCSYKEHVVESLLRHGADPNVADVEEFTSLHAMCATDYDDDLAEKFFQICDDMQQKVQVDAQSKLGWTPLHLALFKGKKKATEWLLRKGADPNLANKKGCTPLHAISSREMDDDFAERFFQICDDIRQTVRVDVRDKRDRTPLHLALRKSKKIAAESLLRRGANTNLADSKGFTSLHLICGTTYDDNSAEKFLQICDDMQLTMQIDALDKLGRTPLQLALRTGKKKMVECLLRNGADHNIADAKGLSSLHHIASRKIDDDLMEKFFEICNDMQLKVEVNAQENNGRTPLQVAVCLYKEHVVESLLRNGADPNVADVEEFTSLHAMCATDYDDDLAEKFFQICDDMQLTMQVNARCKLGWTPLHLALFKGKKKATEWLLRKGADPNLVDVDGSTSLHIICKREYDDDLMDIFLKINDDMQQTVHVDVPDNLGSTPLHFAVFGGNKRIIETLLRKGADPNSADVDGLTSLHHMALRKIDDDLSEKFSEICDELQQTLLVDVRSNFGNTPLHLALRNGKKKTAKSLLTRGADPYLADANGLTSLHIICKKIIDDDLTKDILQLFDDILQTIQVDAQDESGKISLYYAVSSGANKQIIEALLDRIIEDEERGFLQNVPSE